MIDLVDPATRDRVHERLGRLYAGRPVIVGPGILAGYTASVERFAALGCPILVLATARGAGAMPPPGACTVVEVDLPHTASMTEEVRVLDRVARALPPTVVAAIEAFDPERRGVWSVPPFVTDDEPILGRPVTGGRPAAWLALEDKMLADAVWEAAGVAHAPYAVVDAHPAQLSAATAALAGPLGAVWSGDARDGLNGGGNFVRWVAGAADHPSQAAAFAFFAPRCDRVRVMPFLDGVPCSIHGIVLPGRRRGRGGTAAFRPVELAILQDPERRRFVYGGLSTWWDPPPADREAMRDAVRRVGEHLADAHGYRGAFGIDGVLTADGFLPTELNTRMSAGVTTIARADLDLFTLLQANLVAGVDTGLGVADLESLLPSMDAERTGRPVCVGQGFSLGGEHTLYVTTRGDELVRSPTDLGSTLVAADTPTGCFAKIDPCTLLAPGDRLAPLNAALLRFLDRELGTSFGGLVPAPDVRARDPRDPTTG